MNPLERDMTADDDRRFDLLVDGELSESERRELLSGLDDEPGGWRRCALAFVEAQSWRRELGAVREEAARRPADAVSTRMSAASAAAEHRPVWWLRTSGTILAMAASFLAAMALGWWVFGPGGAGDLAPVPPVRVAGDGLPPAGATAVPEPGPGQLAEPQLVRQEPAVPREPGAPPEDTPGQWRWFALAPADGLAEGAEPMLLPGFEPRQFDEDWLRSLPGGLPPEVLHALREAGHHVRHHRDLVPFSLEDGRRLLVPVDELDVHYAGNQKYQ
jgi:hypothetical protein